MRDYYIVILEDCVGATNLELHEATLKNVNLHFGRLPIQIKLKSCRKGIMDG
jgi:nicotinamidase-related amidase